MKVSINLKVDAVQKKRLMEEAHKRNLSLKEYLRLLVTNSYIDSNKDNTYEKIYFSINRSNPFICFCTD